MQASSETPLSSFFPRPKNWLAGENLLQQVALSRPLHSDRRKLIPVAQALTDMRAISERTAAGDLAGKQKTRSGKKVVA